MESTPVDHTLAADGAAVQSRREALKMFGRYAATAPAVMVLLQSRESLAGWGNGRGRGKSFGRGKGFAWGKGGRRRRGGGGGDGPYG